jgi:hypothetical protein
VKVYIFGYLGGMGRRYRAILESLGHEVGGEDRQNLLNFSLADADAVIIATPTRTHAHVLMQVKDCGKPILCEKPISKSITVADEVLWELRKAGARLEMVNQYAELDPAGDGPTTYNCYRHGDDGLYWDCISLIRLARGPIELREDSPTWQCTLNGRQLTLGDVDAAYLRMIDRWLRDPTRGDYNELMQAHNKVADLEAASCQGS